MAGGLVLAAKGAAALPFVGGVAAAGMGKFAALGKLGVAGNSDKVLLLVLLAILSLNTHKMKMLWEHSLRGSTT